MTQYGVSEILRIITHGDKWQRGYRAEIVYILVRPTTHLLLLNSNWLKNLTACVNIYICNLNKNSLRHITYILLYQSPSTTILYYSNSSIANRFRKLWTYVEARSCLLWWDFYYFSLFLLYNKTIIGCIRNKIIIYFSNLQRQRSMF